MSDENRDGETGQFTPAEPLVGLAGIEHEAGWVPYKDEKAPPADDNSALTVAEAAEIYAPAHTPESEIRTYSPIDLPDNVSLTVEQAAKIMTDMDAADAEQAEQEQADKIRKEVDELRGEVEAKTKEIAEAKTASEIGKDPKADVERFLELPHVKEHVDRWNSETEAVRQTYSKATDLANDFARSSFIENFPEIAGLPLEQWDGALTAMAQREPERFGKAINSLQRVMQLQAAQQQNQQQRAFAERQQFEVYSKEQNAIFAERTKDVPTAQMRAIEAEVPKMLQEYGASPAQFLEAIGTNTTFPRAAAEMLILDAARYRMIKAAPKPVPVRDVPPVQRPGTSRPSGQAATSERIQALNRKSELTVKEATELYTYQTSRRTR